jgi:hypothetical protein
MYIQFWTNIDAYKRIDWYEPKVLPRIREFVHIPDQYKENFNQRNLPTRLQVIAINFFEDHVRVELHFYSQDYEIFKNRDTINIFER